MESVESIRNPGGIQVEIDKNFGWAPCQINSRWNDQESMGECKVLIDAMVDTKESTFVSRLDLFRLPFDSLGAWRMSSPHGDKNCNVFQHG